MWIQQFCGVGNTVFWIATGVTFVTTPSICMVAMKSTLQKVGALMAVLMVTHFQSPLSVTSTVWLGWKVTTACPGLRDVDGSPYDEDWWDPAGASTGTVLIPGSPGIWPCGLELWLCHVIPGWACQSAWPECPGGLVISIWDCGESGLDFWLCRVFPGWDCPPGWPGYPGEVVISVW